MILWPRRDPDQIDRVRPELPGDHPRLSRASPAGAGGFAELMIGHHQGAVTMAKDEQKNGSNADARKLADVVVAAQTAEIEKMNKILDRL
ncbi:DUF305 domain-containing protein [Streptomyces sp. NPDC005065]|uniref:DUF305 domain-containing protein n=1 Tax=unclassified Streptomyces TaxID=2593676 RepID=UPI0033BB2C9F